MTAMLEAGAFAPWLSAMVRALDDDVPSEVPCGSCTACCTGSQFVHITPDETDSLAHIPAGLLFPAPRRPEGHVLLGYDDDGNCPMLVEGACSIYEHRPRTCRTYDCRVFPAAGIELDEEDQPLIAARAASWRFSYATDADRRAHDAVRSAGAFLRDHRDLLPAGSVGVSPTAHAVLAVRLHDVFLDRDDEDVDAVAVVIRARLG